MFVCWKFYINALFMVKFIKGERSYVVNSRENLFWFNLSWIEYGKLKLIFDNMVIKNDLSVIGLVLSNSVKLDPERAKTWIKKCRTTVGQPNPEEDLRFFFRISPCTIAHGVGSGASGCSTEPPDIWLLERWIFYLELNVLSSFLFFWITVFTIEPTVHRTVLRIFLFYVIILKLH